MPLVQAQCQRTGHSIELTEDSESVVRYIFNGERWPSNVTTRAALLGAWDQSEPLPTMGLAFELLLRFINANDALVSSAEEERLP